VVVGAISGRTELAIVGAGPGGYVAALRAADAGLEVTLIDRDGLGGTCLNVGCIPSKTLIEVANLRHAALSASDRGLNLSGGVDVAVLHEHTQQVTRGLQRGVKSLLASAGVTVVEGEAHFARYDRLAIRQGDSVQHLEFDNVIIATGSRPIELPLLPFGDRVVSSTGALAFDALPPTMAIVGAGYIGVELGTAWAKLGTRVTLIEAKPRILPDLAAELARPVAERLLELGVQVRTGQRAQQQLPTGLLLEGGEPVDAEVIVVAVGRMPNTDRASIDTLPIEFTQSGHIVVDDAMRAGPGIYAIGDIVPGPALAHKATAEAEVCVDTIVRKPSPPRSDVIPAVVFSDPEIMTVGISLDQAQGHGCTVSRFPLRASARAQTIGSVDGATYLVVDRSQTIVGVHAVGPHVSELAGSAALAVELAATIEDLSLTIHPHPTISESLPEAAWIARGHPLHVRNSS